MSLLTLAEFTDYLKNETGASDASQIQGAYETGVEAVQAHCGGAGWRLFDDTATSVSARVYVPQSCTVVRVHDFQDVTGLIVSNNGTIVSSSDYQLEPLNAPTLGKAYEQIRLISGSWYEYRGKATVTVTAKWGWDTVPARASEAVKLIGKDYVTGRGSKFGFVETSVGVAQGGRNWLALNALANLRRVEAFGIA